MKVKLLTDGGYHTPGIVGHIVEAQYWGESGGVDVKLSELMPLDSEWESESAAGPNYPFYFDANEIQVIEND